MILEAKKKLETATLSSWLIGSRTFQFSYAVSFNQIIWQCTPAAIAAEDKNPQTLWKFFCYFQAGLPWYTSVYSRLGCNFCMYGSSEKF